MYIPPLYSLLILTNPCYVKLLTRNIYGEVIEDMFDMSNMRFLKKKRKEARNIFKKDNRLRLNGSGFDHVDK